MSRQELGIGKKVAVTAVAVATAVSLRAGLAPQKASAEPNLKTTGITLNLEDQTPKTDIGEAWHIPYKSFVDVPDDDAAINYLYEHRIIEGFVPVGLDKDILEFRPNSSITREQVAKIIVVAFKIPVSETDVSKFKDVENSGPDSLYPDNYIAALEREGITDGVTSTEFNPYGKVTGEQLVSMLARTVQKFSPDSIKPVPSDYQSVFNDETDVHTQNLRTAQYNGLLSSIQDLSRWDYQSPVKRGEAAQIIVNSLKTN